VRLKKYTFHEVAEEVRQVNPEFVELVKDIKGADQLTVYKTQYDYGDYIVKNGVFYIYDDNNRACRLNELTGAAQKDLSYNLGNPISMPLNKPLDMFITLDNQSIPFYLYKPGLPFGFSALVSMHRPELRIPAALNAWDVTAGPRNILFLPKIAEERGLNALMTEFDFVCHKPETLFDHWQIARGIGKRDKTWQCELLLLSKDWFDQLNKTSWLPLRNYFYDCFNIVMQYYINILSWNLTFSLVQQKRNILSSVPQHETIKYLFGVASKYLLAHKVATDNYAFPLKFIQQAMFDIYDIKDYAPLMMEPSLFDEKQPVYYSLQYPMHASPIKLDASRSIIQRLGDLTHLIDRYQNELIHESKIQQGTALINAARNTDFSFYHRSTRQYNFMHDSNELLTQADFKKAMKTPGEFPYSAKFLNGLIKISLSDKDSSTPL